jgi:ketosteroid isomerase-like protein
MPQPDKATQVIAKRIKAALDAGDVSTFRELLDPEVRWGPPHAKNPGCKSRDQVMAWYERGKASGAEGRVSEVEVLGHCVLVGLTVRGTPEAKERGGFALRWQVHTVADGRVIDIVGFDDRNDAKAYAETVLRSEI